MAANAQAPTTLLLGGAIITIDHDRRTLDPGTIAIQHDMIVAVGEWAGLENDFPEANPVAQRAFKLAGVEHYLEQPPGMWRSARYPS